MRVLLEGWIGRLEQFYSTLLEAVQRKQQFKLSTLLSGRIQFESKSHLRMVCIFGGGGKDWFVCTWTLPVLKLYCIAVCVRILCTQ